MVYGYYKNENGITHTSKKKLKSIDSLYITESLLKDHLKMNFDITLDYYEYFLRMVRLTYFRTREMDEEVRQSIFLCQCHLYENYFNSFTTDFATGRYLMFLDSDDEMLPNSINALLDRAYEYDADIVEGGFRYIYSNGKYSNNPSSNEIKEISMPFGILEDFFLGGGKVYKREMFDGFRLPEGYWFEDSLNLHILF